MIDLRIFRYYSDVSRPMHKFIPINLGNSTEAPYCFCKIGRVFNKAREYSSVLSFYTGFYSYHNVAYLHDARRTTRSDLLIRTVFSFHLALSTSTNQLISFSWLRLREDFSIMFNRG